MMSATQIHVDGVVLIISLLFASLCVLIGTSIYILHDDIELHLINTVTERIEEEGYQVSVNFDGRDGTISGIVDDSVVIEELSNVAKSVEGVRTIVNKLEVAPSKTSAKTETPESESTRLEGLDNMSSPSENAIIPMPSAAGESIQAIVNEIPDDSFITGNDIEEPEMDEIEGIEGISQLDESQQQNLTEVAEKPIIEMTTMSFDIDKTDLSSEQRSLIEQLLSKIKADDNLSIEMSSFHHDPKIAIKRTENIKDYFANHGISNKHFDVTWHSSEQENQVQLKLFNNTTQ